MEHQCGRDLPHSLEQHPSGQYLLLQLSSSSCRVLLNACTLQCAGAAPPLPRDAPPLPEEPEAKRQRTEFVLTPEEEYADAHPGQQKVGRGGRG
jgi:hypothetical protein